jgi:hypothetical protein
VRSREARNHSMIGAEAPASISPRIAARKHDNPGHVLVLQQRGTMIRNVRYCQFTHKPVIKTTFLLYQAAVSAIAGG